MTLATERKGLTLKLNKLLHKIYSYTKNLKYFKSLSKKLKTQLFKRGKLITSINDLSRINLEGCINPLHYNLLTLQKGLSLIYGSSMIYNLIYTQQNEYPLIVCEVAVTDRKIVDTYLESNLTMIKTVVEERTDVLFSYIIYEFDASDINIAAKKLKMDMKYN